jgi:two-component system LytT family response regulator
MRIVVVEDEPPAREKLVAAIRAVEPGATIAATLAGVAETVAWLERNPQPDLLFLDIQLSDGLSFDILHRTRVECPVIFATAYDEYLLDAFDSNGIDYLLKPVREDRLAAAIGKYRRLRDHFTSGQAALIERISRERSGRERLLVRKGNDYISLKVSEIAWVRSAEKLTFLMTGAGVQYLLDRSLAELEAELDASRFFRTNRAWLVAIDAVIRCRQYGKGRLLLDLRPKPSGEEVVVSQERAAAFRKWLGQ